MSTQHTPYLPVVTRETNQTGWTYIESALGEDGTVCMAREEYAAFIVLVVNNHEVLLEAVKAGLAALYEAQGDWVDVLPPYAPEWTYSLKDATEHLETAIAAVEGGGTV